MYVRKGAYQHDANEASISYAIRRIPNQRGVNQTAMHTLGIAGELYPATATQDQMRTKINAFIAAYDKDYEDVGLYHDDGSKSPHFLTNSNAIGGVKVVSRSWPGSDGSEYITHRSYTVQLEAEYKIANTSDLLVWEESLTVVGDGGPAHEILETRYGPPVPQTTSQRTRVIANQSGRAVGLTAYVPYPSPLFPQWIKRDGIQQQKGSPRFDGNGFRDYQTSWSYQYESPTPLFGNPNAR